METVSPKAANALEPSTGFDGMARDKLQSTILGWLGQTDPLELGIGEIDELINAALPRTQFVKSLPQEANLLDLGAGDGSLTIYKSWPKPDRSDVKMYGLSLVPIERAAHYHAVAYSDFEGVAPVFEDVQFDAVVCAHFIEHMKDPRRVIEFFASRLRPGGTAYIEWPHRISKNFPSRREFINRGFPTSTMNFADDPTHIETWGMAEVAEIASGAGLAIEGSGRVRSPYLANHLRDAAKRTTDLTRLTLSIWWHFGWAQYLVARKV